LTRCPALPRLKEELELNVEVTSPAHFLPELPGGRERCRYVGREGPLDFFHYDPYARTLSKLERAHERDLADAEEMVARSLVEPARLRELFEAIVSGLHRFPAVDPPSLRRRVEEFCARHGG